MDWQARLTERRVSFQKGASCSLTKLTEPLPEVTSVSSVSSVSSLTKPTEPTAGTSVSSVSLQDGRFQNIDVAALRARLFNLADAEDIDPAHVAALTAADLEDCVGESDDFLRSYLAALADSALRNRGHVPEGATAAALCAHCGPIWLHPSVAAVAPVVAGWPRVLGCPWCHVANAAAIPRPSVTCGACRHFMRDTVNPAEGIGRCARGVTPRSEEPTVYPKAQRRCAQFRA